MAYCTLLEQKRKQPLLLFKNWRYFGGSISEISPVFEKYLRDVIGKKLAMSQRQNPQNMASFLTVTTFVYVFVPTKYAYKIKNMGLQAYKTSLSKALYYIKMVLTCIVFQGVFVLVWLLGLPLLCHTVILILVHYHHPAGPGGWSNFEVLSFVL